MHAHCSVLLLVSILLLNSQPAPGGRLSASPRALCREGLASNGEAGESLRRQQFREYARSDSGAGKQGSILIGGVINRYGRILSYDAAANVATLAAAQSWGCSDIVLVIQMNGVRYDTSNTLSFGTVLDYNGAGSFEFTNVVQLDSTTVAFSPPLRNTYDFSAVVQLITVPEYHDATVIDSLRPAPWDGLTGGVLALIADTLRLDADINAQASGFRGGDRSDDGDYSAVKDFALDPASRRAAYKGEGIAQIAAKRNSGRGPAANGGGGGNGNNSGGAGGGCGGLGGRGGLEHNGAGGRDIGGLGGAQLDFGNNTSPRAFMGGGGGGGHQNDSRGTGGGTGGGIVFISAGVFDGKSHRVRADGASVIGVAGNDGAGGGGAGGTICMATTTIRSRVTLSAQGGHGGNLNNANNVKQCHGPGGGGAGGVIRHSGPTLDLLAFTALTGGAAGWNIEYPSPCLNTPDGATNGTDGKLFGDLVLPPYTAATPMTIRIPDTVLVCPDTCATLSALVRGGSRPYRYAWTPVDPRFAADSTVMVCPTGSTEYSVTATDCAGAFVSARSVVMVLPRIALTIARSGDTLTASYPGLLYQWFHDGVVVAGEHGQSLLARRLGRYSVISVPPQGCPVSAEFTVLPRPLVVLLPDTQHVCPDSCVQLHPQFDGGIAPYRFQWTPAASLSSPTDSTPVACPGTVTRYELTVTDSLGAMSSAAVVVSLAPRLLPVITRFGDTLVAIPCGVQAQWYRDGVRVSGGSGCRLAPVDSGRFTVEIWSQDGCPEWSPPLDYRPDPLLAVTAVLSCPPSALVAPGQRVSIPVRLALPITFSTSGINGAELWLHARGGVLFPADKAAIASQLEGTQQMLRVQRDVVAASTADIVIALDFIALLGDTACTRIMLDSVTWRGGAMRVTRENGACDICVQPCTEGGARFFDARAGAGRVRNHPDPFNASTTIEYTVPEDGPYALWLEDALGRRRLTLVEGRDGLGEHRTLLERRDLPSGFYFCVLQTQTWLARKKMLILN